MTKPSVLFVCLGNICRSPTAHGIARARFSDSFSDIDSAGTASYHAGDAPDRRSAQTLAARQIDITDLRARQIAAADYTRFTHIIAMDTSNLASLTANAPQGATAQLSCLLDWMPGAPSRDVPDPYYEDNFDDVFVMINRAVCEVATALSTDQPSPRA